MGGSGARRLAGRRSSGSDARAAVRSAESPATPEREPRRAFDGKRTLAEGGAGGGRVPPVESTDLAAADEAGADGKVVRG